MKAFESSSTSDFSVFVRRAQTILHRATSKCAQKVLAGGRVSGRVSQSAEKRPRTASMKYGKCAGLKKIAYRLQ